MKKLFALFLIQIVMVPLMYAQGTYTWAGSTDSEVTTGSNWVGGVAPTFPYAGGSYKINDNIIVPASCSHWPVFSASNYRIGHASPIAVSITINSGGNATFSSNLGVGYVSNIGSLIIQARGSFKVNGQLIIAGTGTMFIQSDNSGEGQLIYGSFSGNASVELYLTGGGIQYHYFIPALSVNTGFTILSVKTALSIANFTGGLLSYDEPSATTKQAGWWYFDGFDWGYGATDGFESITPSQGYNIHLSGNDKLTFNGALSITSQTFNLSFTSGNEDPGWNLIGNPFTCNYDITTVPGLGTVVSGIGNVVHYNQNGNYYYYNCYKHAGSLGYTDIVPPMTGFFVQAFASGKSLSFDGSGRTFTSGDTRSLHKGTVPKSNDNRLIRIALNSGSETDESIVFLEDDANENFNEHYDGVKLFGKNTSYIYSELNFRDYFMKAVTPPAKTLVEVPLKVKLGTSGEQSISITQFDNMQDFNVKLKHGTVETPLKSGTAYTFNSEAGTYDDFSLIFENATVGVETNEFISLKTWYAGSYLYMNFADNFTEGIGSLTIFDFNGRKVSINNNLQITPGETIQVPVNLVKGFYIIDLLSGNKHYKSKIVVY